MKDLQDKAWGWDYEELIDSMEFDYILMSETEHDYQGDSFYAVKKDGKYGFLKFGWGSCSGCDALQACGADKKEATSLRDDLYLGVMWFDNLDDLRAHVVNSDAELQWYNYSEAFKIFRHRMETFSE